MIKKAVRVVAALCLIFLSSIPIAVSAADVPPWNKNDSYVQDHANVLSAEQKEELNRYGQQLNDATGAELAVLTLPSIGDEAIDEFAVKALRKYGLGKKGEDNGALLVVTTEKRDGEEGGREFFLTTGYGLEGALPDGKIGRIIDELAMPYLLQERPDSAIVESYKTFYNEIAAEYNWNGEVAPVTVPTTQASNSDFGVPFPIIVFIIIYVLFRIFRNGGGRGGGVVDQDVTVEGVADRFSSQAHLVAVVVVASVEVAASPVEVDPAAEAELAAVGNL